MNVLCVVAHADDEVLCAGGTMARMSDEGADIAVLALGGARRETETRLDLQWQLEAATKILDVKALQIPDFPDQQFDAVPFLELIHAIEFEVHANPPDLVITHFLHDLNQDHQLTAQAGAQKDC